MSIPSTIHTDVRDLLFADWAEVVTFREVSSAYDPAAGDVVESVLDTELLAILGPVLNPPTPDTAHQHQTLERTFLVRAEDLPPSAVLATSRILHAGREFALLAADHAAVTSVTAIHARSLD